MIGNNEFHLNEATMIEIVQIYINKFFPTNTPKVTNIEIDSTYNCKTFNIKLISEEIQNDQ